MSPPISIVVPLFNKEKSVGRCLASILRQTHPASEIIIVNDGSTDNSRQAVQLIQDPRIRLLDQANGGVSTARNLGLAQATHEYVALLDADDEWAPVFLEKMVFLIEQFPTAGLYYAGYTGSQNKRKVVPSPIAKLPLGHAGIIDIFKYNLGQGPCSSSTVLRKSFLEKAGGFDPLLVKGEDTDLWIRFALAGPVAYYNLPLAFIHMDAENRAMRKPCPPAACLVSNLARYEPAARTNPQLRQYLQQMRLGHICNFLGGDPCELADAHREIDQLDLRLSPPVWAYIRRSPRCLRGIVFRLYAHASRLMQFFKP